MRPRAGSGRHTGLPLLYHFPFQALPSSAPAHTRIGSSLRATAAGMKALGCPHPVLGTPLQAPFCLNWELQAPPLGSCQSNTDEGSR